MSRNSVASDALRTIASIWQADESRTTWLDSGFDWVPGSHLVRVRAAQREGHDDGRWRISVRTDFLKSVPYPDDMFLQSMEKTLCRFTSTYCWFYPPASVRKLMQEPTETIEFFSSAYVGDDTLGWLPRFLAQTALLQPIDAETQSRRIPEFLRAGEPDFAAGKRAQVLDEILEIAGQIYVPMGREPSRWSGCSEFVAFAEHYGRTDFCFGLGDPAGLTLETPCGSDSFLVRLRPDENHPQLGSGLLVTVEVPMRSTRSEMENAAALLNFAEATDWTDFPQLGCWHPRATDHENVGLAHSSFVPNALYAEGLVTNFGIWSVARTQWARNTLWPKLQDRPMHEILEGRFRQKSAPGRPS
jgi:hypothetical protein